MKEGRVFTQTERTPTTMKYILIVLQITILYGFYFIGTIIHDYFHLSIPGSIIALILLFVCLCMKIIPVSFIDKGSGFLLSILTLFYIPATVGIMNYPSLLSLHGILLVVVILLSTIVSIAITGKMSALLEKKKVVKKG